MHTRYRKSAGLPPGSLVFVGEQRVEQAAISVIDYDATELYERTIESPDECRGYVDKPTVTWINVTGLHDVTVLDRMGRMFGIHPLLVEDILHTGQRPKTEDHGNYIFIVLKMIYLDREGRNIQTEQVSMVLGANYLLTFQEIEGDVFGLIRDRIRTAKGRIRSAGCDYLAYSLLDAIVDNYFVVLEELGDRIERLQEDVVVRAGTDTLQKIHQLKGQMISMRKSVWPLRELVSSIEKSESPLIHDATGPYLRDVYEHTIQVIDTVETLRDMLSTAMDIYMSSVSNRMNEIMRVLTVIATIFIPLTFIVGVYGMNFEFMPELKWHWGYAGVWGVIVATALGMLAFFRRRKWL